MPPLLLLKNGISAIFSYFCQKGGGGLLLPLFGSCAAERRDSTQDRFSASVTCADNTGLAYMSFPSSPVARHAVAPSPATRHDYYPPNLSPFDTFANTPCTSLTRPDAAVVLETALLWVRPGHSNAVVRAGALAMQNGCARLLALDHGYLENLFSDANR